MRFEEIIGPLLIGCSLSRRAPRQATNEVTSLTVYEMDERFTSVEAEGLLRESGVQPSRDRATVDETAAMLILQRFLGSKGT